MVSEQAVNEWRQHPVTQELLRILGKWQEELCKQWMYGRFTDQSQYATAILNAKAVGSCEAYDKVKNFNYEQVLTETADDEHFGS